MPLTFPLAGGFPVSTLAVLVFLVKATVILLVAAGITRVMHRASAGTRHLVWLVALGALLLVPALTAWSPLRVAVLPAQRVAVEQPVPAGLPSDVVLPSEGAPVVSPASAPSAPVAADTPARSTFT